MRNNINLYKQELERQRLREQNRDKPTEECNFDEDDMDEGYERLNELIAVWANPSVQLMYRRGKPIGPLKTY